MFVLIGDGSYLLMNSEIVTAIQEGIDFTVVVVDNKGFQSIHGLQRSVGTPSFGNELRHRDPTTGRLSGAYIKVDFVKHAEALGARAYRAETADELRQALADARGNPTIDVIVVPVDPGKRVPSFEGWWDVPVAEVSGQREVERTRAAYLDARRHERVFV